MIIDYKLNAKYLPSERDVWLMSGRAERDGHQISRALLNAFESGEVKYVDGQFYRLCRHCMDYLPLTDFYENKRYVLNVSYLCRGCTATRRRLKTYGVASYVSDVGMRDVPNGITFSLNPDTVDVIKARLKGGLDGHSQEEDI